MPVNNSSIGDGDAPRREAVYVIVAGNVGVGKTTIIDELSKKYESMHALKDRREVFWEKFLNNPREYAFLNQLTYALLYLEQAIYISNLNGLILQERSAYDSYQVFTKSLIDSGLISLEQAHVLDRIYVLCSDLVRPNLLVYLDAEETVCYERVLARGYDSERHLSLDTIEWLRKSYSEWYRSFDVCEKVLVRTSGRSVSQVVADVLAAIRM